MSFWEHLEELRWRLIKSLAAVLVTSIIAFLFSDWMLAIITRPIDKIYFIGIGEAFSVRIKLSLFAGLVLALPVLFY